MQRKDKTARIACIAVMIVFLLTNLAVGIYYLLQGVAYSYVLAFSALLLPLVLTGLYRLLRYRRVYQLDILIYAFFLALYTVGLSMYGYHRIPLYDKFAHTFAGVFTSILALILFYVLKPKKEIEKSDFPLVCVFTLSVSVAVAGVWEIAEFIISLIFGTDPQNVQGTGVGDTMWDIIVCTAGALVMLIPYAFYYQKGKRDLFMKSFELMFERNIKPSKN